MIALEYFVALLLFAAMLRYCAWLLYMLATERSASTGNPAHSPALRFS